MRGSRRGIKALACSAASIHHIHWGRCARKMCFIPTDLVHRACESSKSNCLALKNAKDIPTTCWLYFRWAFSSTSNTLYTTMSWLAWVSIRVYVFGFSLRLLHSMSTSPFLSALESIMRGKGLCKNMKKRILKRKKKASISRPKNRKSNSSDT